MNDAPFDQRQRAARLVTESPDGRFHIDGVRWGFQETGHWFDWQPYWRDAVVDSRRVKDVYITIEPFAPEWLAAHAFLAFELEPGHEVRSGAGERDGGLVVSVEAHMRRGQEFGLVAGVLRTYGIVYQVGTWTDVVQKSCRAQGHKLIRHKLALTQEQKQRMLVNTLRRATADHSRECYNTVTNSCLTSAIKEINSALPWRHRVWAWLAPGIPNIAAALPRTADIVLTARGSLSDSPCILTQPERDRFPRAQATNTYATLAAARLSTQRVWRPGMRLLGLAAGLAFGSLMGERSTRRKAALAMAGQFLGRVAADLIKSRALTRFEPSEPYLDGERRMSGS